MAQPALLYIPYATSYHEQTGIIVTFAKFEEGVLLENKNNLVEYGSILASIGNRLQTLTLMKNL